ncbi:MAG TPA: hypothetical protein V6D15_23435 [Oculatellaceae cyanobacterium]|jgi:hypothetical protein
MIDFNTICEFSRNHCVAICAFLVPANLLATIATIILTALCRPAAQVRRVAGIGNIIAGVMIFHVLTWFMVGVVMAPTYVLFILASTCLSVNCWAIAHPSSMVRLIRGLLAFVGYNKQQLASNE